MKKVSVVVPCYNAAKYLDKCVGKLLNQTIGRDAMEIILVDDASTDAGETWKLITEYEQRFPDTVLAVKLEQNLRQGLSLTLVPANSTTSASYLLAAR